MQPVDVDSITMTAQDCRSTLHEKTRRQPQARRACMNPFSMMSGSYYGQTRRHENRLGAASSAELHQRNDPFFEIRS